MKIIDFVQKLNGKIRITDKWLKHLKRYYVNMYRVNMVYLYDNAYISDPSRLIPEEIYKNIADMGIIGMTDNNGTICLKSRHAKLALALYKDMQGYHSLIDEAYDEPLVDSYMSEDIMGLWDTFDKNVVYRARSGEAVLVDEDYFSREWILNGLNSVAPDGNDYSEIIVFLSYLSEALRYREYCHDIDVLYDSLDMGGQRSRSASIGLVQVYSVIRTKAPYSLSKAIVTAFAGEGNKVVEVKYNKQLWPVCMGELGIPEDEQCEDGLFVKGMSHDNEVEFMSEILDGNVKLSGKYADRLYAWLHGHKWKKGLYNYSKGLYSYVFTNYAEECIAILYSYINMFNNLGDEVIAVYESTFFLKKPITEYNIPMGTFAVSADSETVLESATLDGYTGEVYPLEYLEREGIEYVGCPIMLHYDEKLVGSFFDLEEVDVISESWFKRYNVDLTFSTEGRDEYKLYTHSGSMEDNLLKILNNSTRGRLVGRLKNLVGFGTAKEHLIKALFDK